MTPIKSKDKDFIYKDLTYNIIGCAMNVHKILGVGFLESVYEKCLLIELKKAGLHAESTLVLKIVVQGVVSCWVF